MSEISLMNGMQSTRSESGDAKSARNANSDFRIVLLASVPVSLLWTLSWFGVFTFVNAYLIKGLRYSNAEWSAVSLWFVGGMIIWKMIVTEISARIGRRKTIFSAMLIATLVWIIIGSVQSRFIIGLLLAVMGCVPACTMVVWFPMVAEVGKRKPGRALAAIQIVATITTVLVMLLGGRLIAGDNFSTIFIACALFSGFGAVVFYWVTSYLRATPNERIVSLFQLRMSDIKALLKSSFPVLLILGCCMEPFGFHTLNQLFPNLARDAHGLSEFQISSIVAVGRISALLSLFILARYIDRLIPTVFYGLGIILAGVAIVLSGAADRVSVLLGGYILFYVGQGAVWGANSASVNAAVESRLRDSAFAFMSLFMIFAVFGVGYVHNWMLNLGMPVSGVFITSGAITVCGGLALAIYGLFLNSKHIRYHKAGENKQNAS